MKHIHDIVKWVVVTGDISLDGTIEDVLWTQKSIPDFLRLSRKAHSNDIMRRIEIGIFPKTLQSKRYCTKCVERPLVAEKPVHPQQLYFWPLTHHN